LALQLLELEAKHRLVEGLGPLQILDVGTPEKARSAAAQLVSAIKTR
jgi:hypothetical protein